MAAADIDLEARRAHTERQAALAADVAEHQRRLHNLIKEHGDARRHYRRVGGRRVVLRQTLRHLVFATDMWLGRAILQIEQPFHPVGQMHRLSDVDTGALTGVCSYCGPVAVKGRRRPNGLVWYVCDGAPGRPRRAPQHRLSGVDLDARTAVCDRCGGVVAFIMRGGGRYQCRGPVADYEHRRCRHWVHRMTEADPVAGTGVCSHCGPATLKARGGGQRGYRCGKVDRHRDVRDPSTGVLRSAPLPPVLPMWLACQP